MISKAHFPFIALATALRWKNAHAWINPALPTTFGSGDLHTRGGDPLFNTPQHDVNGQQTIDDLTPEQQERVKAFIGHQQNVPKIGFAADVRSLVQYNHGFAVMSTNSKSNPGFPGGSVVGFAVDDDGCPLFVFSGMSSHTQDILKDPRCSLTVADKNFKGASDGRVNLMGNCTRLRDSEEIDNARQSYLKKHPGAFWANFGDFNWFRMDIKAIRFVGGFARAGSVKPADYLEASPDPIMAFGGAIADHMNDDHMSATVAMVKHYIPGLDIENYVKEAIINRVDSVGMDIKITRNPEDNDTLPGQPQQFKVRLPFPEPITERGGVKTAIVEMTRAAAPSPSETEMETKEA
jgi:putative heme iron utilization protein